MQAPQKSFLQFVFKEKENKRMLLVALVATVVLFSVFKVLYPFPDFFSDSYYYIFAASAHLDVSIWPIGYSKFLILFHSLTHSDIALVGFQYLLLQIACLYFYFSLLYFFALNRSTRIILYVFLFFNPLLLYLCNYVNSDPLFIAISILWFTELIWILNRPSFYQVFTQGILLFLSFTIRNNAYYYPIIAILAFGISQNRLWIKFVGSFLGLALIIPFILSTREAAKKMTGSNQFSLFTGWQLANNALYIYNHISIDSNLFPTLETKDLNRMSQLFYNHTDKNFDVDLFYYIGNYFIREPQSPLKQYYIKHFKKTDKFSTVVNWGKVSIIFNDWGNIVIRQNLSEFIRYFILPNIKNYLLPPLEKLEIYNTGLDEIDNMGQFWFDYKSTDITSVSKRVQGKILFIFPYLFLIVNFYFFSIHVWFLIRNKYQVLGKKINSFLLISSIFWLMNFIFSISATIIVFRYEIFPMIIALSSSLLLLGWTDTQIHNEKEGKQYIELQATKLQII